jgi:hypothetical protein
MIRATYRAGYAGVLFPLLGFLAFAFRRPSFASCAARKRRGEFNALAVTGSGGNLRFG